MALNQVPNWAKRWRWAWRERRRRRRADGRRRARFRATLRPPASASALPSSGPAWREGCASAPWLPRSRCPSARRRRPPLPARCRCRFSGKQRAAVSPPPGTGPCTASDVAHNDPGTSGEQRAAYCSQSVLHTTGMSGEQVVSTLRPRNVLKTETVCVVSILHTSPFKETSSDGATSMWVNHFWLWPWDLGKIRHRMWCGWLEYSLTNSPWTAIPVLVSPSALYRPETRRRLPSRYWYWLGPDWRCWKWLQHQVYIDCVGTGLKWPASKTSHPQYILR